MKVFWHGLKIVCFALLIASDVEITRYEFKILYDMMPKIHTFLFIADLK